MEPPRQDSFAGHAAASCHIGCRFAQPLSSDYADWIWCTHPAVTVRVRQLASDCPATHRFDFSGRAA
jgi:hypothetical protein